MAAVVPEQPVRRVLVRVPAEDPVEVLADVKNPAEAVQAAVLARSDAVLPLHTVANFRDVGGMRGLGGALVRRGCVYRSARPDHLSDEEARHIALQLGIRSILDLRALNEVRRVSDANEHLRQLYKPVVVHFHRFGRRISYLEGRAAAPAQAAAAMGAVAAATAGVGPGSGAAESAAAVLAEIAAPTPTTAPVAPPPPAATAGAGRARGKRKAAGGGAANGVADPPPPRPASSLVTEMEQRGGSAAQMLPVPSVAAVEDDANGRRLYHLDLAGAALIKSAPWWVQLVAAALYLVGLKVWAVQLVVKHSINPGGLYGMYRAFLDRCQPRIAEALRLASNPANHPVLIHCTQGKDRTGLVVALMLHVLGVDEEQVCRRRHGGAAACRAGADG